MEDGKPGQTLQTIELHTACQLDNATRALAQHGSVQMVAFESNEQGLKVTIFIRGSECWSDSCRPEANLRQLDVHGRIQFRAIGAFRGESERWALATPINLYASNGLEFNYDIYVEETGLQNDISCYGEVRLAMDIYIG